MRSGILALLFLGVTACDIEFVAVGPGTDGAGAVHLSVVSHQEVDLEAQVHVHFQGETRRPRLHIQGAEAIMEPSADGWTFGDTLRVDSLSPVLDLALEAEGDSLAVSIPLLARRGSSRPAPNGDLLVPVVRGGSVLEESLGQWRVTVTDSGGNRLLELRADGALPDPLVIPAVLLPEGAAMIHVRTDALARPDAVATTDVDPWTVTTTSQVIVPIDDP